MISKIAKLMLLSTVMVSFGMLSNSFASVQVKKQGAKTIAPAASGSKVSGDDKKSSGKATEEKSSEPVNPGVLSSDKAVPPTLKINGFTLFNTYVVNQSNRTNGKGGAPVHFATDVSDLYFTIAGKAQGVDYMYRVNFQAFPNSSPSVDQNYIQIKTDAYAFRLGNTVGPEDFAIKDAGSVIGGAGGFETGAYSSVYNLSAGVIKMNDNIMDTGKSLKIVFLGPEYMGFQFFAAYTPNTAKGGDMEKNNTFPDNRSIPGNSKGIYPEKSAQPYGMNNWAFGFNYKVASNLWSLVLSGATVTERSFYTVSSKTLPINRFALRNAWAYQLGGVLGYNKWQLGLGYLNNGKARLPKVANMPLNSSGTVHTGNMHLGNAGQAWNAGLGYTVGAYEFAASYQHFWRKTDATNRARNNVWSGTVDFNIFQGWKMYFELDYIKSKTNQTTVDFANAVNREFGSNLNQAVGNNAGTVAILGTKISF